MLSLAYNGEVKAGVKLITLQSLVAAEEQRYQIHAAIGLFHRHTCLQWVDGDKVPYNATVTVLFQKMKNPLLCQTQIRIKGSKVRMQLGDACFQERVLVHEMMHLLGFGHEHQRADRDCYVIYQQKKGKRAWVKNTLYFSNFISS